MIDLKIQYRGIPESDAVSAAVWDHVEHLEKSFSQIMRCHVVISRPHRKLHQGAIYHVKIRLHMSGSSIIVDREPGINHAHEDVYVALRDAFLAARRQVEDYVRIRSGQVKEKAVRPHGKVIRIFPADDCGFLLSQDNREIYFHRNAITVGDFDSLKIGQEVRFTESMGENGPQVSSMEVVGHSGHYISP